MLREMGEFIKTLSLKIMYMVIAFCVGWLLGVVIAFTPFVEVLNQGLNTIFNSIRFSRDDFPALLGTVFFFVHLFKKVEDY